MKIEETIIWAVFWSAYLAYVVLIMLIKYKGKIVYGTVRDCETISEDVLSRIKVEVNGKIIKTRISGTAEIGSKIRLIKYKGIYVTEDLNRRFLPAALVVLPAVLIIFIFWCTQVFIK